MTSTSGGGTRGWEAQGHSTHPRQLGVREAEQKPASGGHGGGTPQERLRSKGQARSRPVCVDIFTSCQTQGGRCGTG